MNRSTLNKISIGTTIRIIDALIIIGSIIVAYWLRFDLNWNSIPLQFSKDIVRILALYVVISIAVYSIIGVYRVVWRYVGLDESLRTVFAIIVSAILNFITLKVLGLSIPLSVLIMGFVLIVLVTVGTHLLYRFYLHILKRHFANSKETRIMIIGAGDAGRMLLREYTSNKTLGASILCFIDDDRRLWGKRIEGVKIIGGRSEIKDAVKRYQISTIVYAIPSAEIEKKKEILNICKETSCELKILPGLYQLISGEVSVKQLRDINIEDLLGREEVVVNSSEVSGYVNNRIVLVTGGGGSIGSELCRQIALNGPKHLIIVDIYENSAYEIQNELIRKHPHLKLTVLIASVRDADKIMRITQTCKPDIVFHAAAHKHVPLMEVSPHEAVKNNVFGTLNVCKACDAASVGKMVMISTDKAVNPTNVMGATKRLCEMIVQTYDGVSETSFVVTRFGNVLGSNGSVIPLFRKQIAEGGPVTVTDKNIIRYFMTIPEAVSLVLQAGAFANGGEIFVLDMGEPVKIDDMARNLIRLSGFKPDVDIKVIYTGLRPGEKLYEELLMDEEGLIDTENDRIFIGKAIPIKRELLLDDLTRLKHCADNDGIDLIPILQEIVPTFHHV